MKGYTTYKIAEMKFEGARRRYLKNLNALRKKYGPVMQNCLKVMEDYRNESSSEKNNRSLSKVLY